VNFKNKIEPVIQEVQIADLRPQLGDDFFSKIIQFYTEWESNNICEAPECWKQLFCGGTFENCGCTVYFDGLDKAIAYYTYARMIFTQSANMGSAGLATPQIQFLSSADYKDKDRRYTEVMRIADRYMKDVLEYIKANCECLGFSMCCKKSIQKRHHNIVIIGN
jgi:hypothetical protein